MDKCTHGHLSCEYLPPDILNLSLAFFFWGATLLKLEIDSKKHSEKSISDLIILITSFNLKKVYD